MEPTIKRHTNYGKKHRTWKTVAQCMWPRTQIWGANGPYATLAPCRELTIEMHLDLASAETTMDAIDAGCGGQCNPRSHSLVLLEAFSAPVADVLPPWCGQCDGASLGLRWVDVPPVPGEADYPDRIARCPRCNPYSKQYQAGSVS